jgi:hypothetical protein
VSPGKGFHQGNLKGCGPTGSGLAGLSLYHSLREICL